MKVFLNGRLVPAGKAVVPITDRGFLYGDGVYETIRVYGGHPFLLPDHLRRLNEALHALRLVSPFSLMDLGRAVQRVVNANRVKDGVARITLSRGSGPRGFGIEGCGKPTVVVTATPAGAYPPRDHRRGITAAVVSVRRTDPSMLSPGIKSNNCLNQILARLEAADVGAREAILLSARGLVSEGSSSNVFVVKDEVILTPRADGHILPGITRNWVIRLAREAGYVVREKAVPLATLAAADEVFLTNAVMEVMPVSHLIFNHAKARRSMRLGPYMKSSGYVGPVTADLMRRFRDSH